MINQHEMEWYEWTDDNCIYASKTNQINKWGIDGFPNKNQV